MCTKKSKNKQWIAKDAVISVCHTESSCAVLRCRELSGSHNHIPVTSACASVCVRLKTCAFVIPKCAVKKKNTNSFFGDNGQKQHITLCYLTPIKTNSSVSIHTVCSTDLFTTSQNENVHPTSYRTIQGEKSKKLRHVLCIVQPEALGSTAAWPQILS